ncbi:tetratricopeptide repeat protein [bacterium]|nr:tetratricopeptide repeat protein [bacterium]
MLRYFLLVGAASCLVLLGACPSAGRGHFKKGDLLFQQQNYGGALIEFEAALEAEPESKMALFKMARCLYKLNRFEDALAAYEKFLSATDGEDRATYQKERWDAAFYRDRCKQELGIEVPQDPSAIPPPPMGE